ncbi:hypothetical protein E2C01_057971 [Portunus trituberculatus]|uniref:Secreted protein n=1 Tax=Portunus trituberculatus TaxID=210409 RepID=A0A5B7H4T1_PORTR|nr:hypothetical protein [Portunus trituberculatus]
MVLISSFLLLLPFLCSSVASSFSPSPPHTADSADPQYQTFLLLPTQSFHRCPQSDQNGEADRVQVFPDPAAIRSATLPTPPHTHSPNHHRHAGDPLRPSYHSQSAPVTQSVSTASSQAVKQPQRSNRVSCLLRQRPLGMSLFSGCSASLPRINKRLY